MVNGGGLCALQPSKRARPRSTPENLKLRMGEVFGDLWADRQSCAVRDNRHTADLAMIDHE
jgi:hypothetical protein